MERYGVKNYCKTSECRKALIEYQQIHKEEIKQKVRNTNLKRYGVDNYVHTPQYKKLMEENKDIILEKRYQTKKKNKSFNKSILEEILYNALLKIFSNNDIERQYRDARYRNESGYKYNCDFYIKPLDLFIELNNFPTHYKEPFDLNSKKHLKLLEHCQNNPNNWIEEDMCKIWAGTDVDKLKCAKKNHLNYVVLYNIEDINNFVKSSKEEKK